MPFYTIYWLVEWQQGKETIGLSNAPGPYTISHSN